MLAGQTFASAMKPPSLLGTIFPGQGTTRIFRAASSRGVSRGSPQARQRLDRAIDDIRMVSGYQRFLLPPEFDDVVADAGAHPLVYAGQPARRRPGPDRPAGGATAETVWLPALTEDALAGEVRAYRDAYQDYLSSPRTAKDRAQWESAIDAVTAFAWDALMGPLLTALGTVPRVTLVPIGLLGVLPLHAAWTPDPASATGRRYALDLTVLTYAPNARRWSGPDAIPGDQRRALRRGG